MRISKLVLAAAMSCSLMVAAYGQEAGGPGRRAAMDPAQRAQAQSEMVSKYLELTDSQKTQFKTAMETARATAQPLREQQRTNRQALLELIKAGKTGGDLDALAAKDGEIQAKLTASEARAFAAFYATLTPDQQTKSETMFNRGPGMFSGGAGGMGGGGWGGQRNGAQQ